MDTVFNRCLYLGPDVGAFESDTGGRTKIRGISLCYFLQLHENLKCQTHYFWPSLSFQKLSSSYKQSVYSQSGISFMAGIWEC